MLGHDAPRPAHEHFQHRQFANRQSQVLAIDANLATHRIEKKRPGLEIGLRLTRPAPRECPNSRGQLRQLEWFGDVVVGARVESGHTVFEAIARRSEEHPSALQSLMRISYDVSFLNK